MPGDHHDTVVRGLSRLEAYVWPTTSLEVTETHISSLFLTDDRVYKVKKPVDLGFVDFSTLERRRFFCEEEFRLNRRLSPDVYLGVVSVCLDHEGLASIGGNGPLVDYAVEMRRLPHEGMLDTKLSRGEIDNRDVEIVVAKLAKFHRSAETSPAIDTCGSSELIRTNAIENINLLEESAEVGTPVASGKQLEFLRASTLKFCDDHEALFRRRVADGFIRDGHGDLHAGNICFEGDDVSIYDCIEFEPLFRQLDVASDIAFLAMDLDLRGFRAFSQYFVRLYAERTDDGELFAVIDFYKTYRALVRAKVSTFTHRQTKALEDLATARRYVQLACSYTVPPAIVMTCGLPGSGKSYAARIMARLFDSTLVRSDVIRKDTVRAREVQKHSSQTHGSLEDGGGPYSEAESDRTYQTMLDATRASFEKKHPRSVIVDANFGQRSRRQPFLELAEELGIPCFVVEFLCGEPTIRARIAERSARGDDESEANFTVYRYLRDRFEPPVEAPWRLAISGEAPPDEVISAVIDLMIERETASR